MSTVKNERRTAVKTERKVSGEIPKMYEWHKAVKSFNVNLTPKLATEFIKTQRDDQRKLKEFYLARLIQALKNGEWIEKTGIAIKFDEYGHMTDGGHRCNLVIRTGITIKQQHVTIGCNPDAYKIYDCGLPRHLADVIYGLGYSNSRTIQSSLNMLSHYVHGDNTWPSSRKDFNHISALKLFSEHPNLAESINKCTITSSVVTPALSALVHYLAGITETVTQEQRDMFVEQIALGTELTLKAPARVFREWRFKHKSSRVHRLNKNQLVAGYIKAWNAFYDGREITAKALQWRARAKSTEPRCQE